MYRKTKVFAYRLISEAEAGDRASRSVDLFIIALILLNVVATIIETLKGLPEAFYAYLAYFEVFSVTIFTIELFVRLWTCTEDPGYSGPVRGRMKFAITPMAMIDLLAILPFYLPMFFTLDLRFLRVLRVFRIFRLLKLGRYSQSMKTLRQVLRARKEELLILLMAIAAMLVVFSSLLYFVEHEAQPHVFESIPHAMWWGVATLTTVGYGDIYPITPCGKFLAAIIALLGVGVFAVPAGILASAFTEAVKKKDSKATAPRVCPHCGKEIDG